MSYTLADLLTAQTADQIKAILLAQLQAKGFPTTDWSEFGVERTLVEMEAEALYDLVTALIPQIVAGGFVSLGTVGWLKLLAARNYATDYNPATSTVGTLVLTCDSANGPYTIAAEELWFESDAGMRYYNTTGGTLTTSGTLSLTIQSEFANDSANGYDYIDDSNTIQTMVTPLPGVTCTNPPTTFSTVSHAGSGSGTIAASGSPTGAHSVTMRVDSSGQSGAGTWSYSLDGAGYAGPSTIAALSIGSSGITITPSNGGTNPSFIAGDLYVVTAPGTWITTQGTDEEGLAALQARCIDRWPSLSSVPTYPLYELWARTASVEVTRVRVAQNDTTPGRVDVLIAGQAGAVASSVINTVQSYINDRFPLGDRPVVASVSAATITLGGTVTLEAAKVTTAKAAILAALSTYFASVDIGGTVRWAEVMQQIMDVDGVVDVSSLTLNSGTANVTLASAEVADWTTQIGTWPAAFTWLTV